MAFGRPKGAASLDALFTVPFLLATAVNIAPAVYLGPTREEIIFVAGGHALFLVRLVFARATAAKQRQVDLERFAAIKRAD
jgi:hypothetical protein